MISGPAKLRLFSRDAFLGTFEIVPNQLKELVVPYHKSIIFRHATKVFETLGVNDVYVFV